MIHGFSSDFDCVISDAREHMQEDLCILEHSNRHSTVILAFLTFINCDVVGHLVVVNNKTDSNSRNIIISSCVY